MKKFLVVALFLVTVLSGCSLPGLSSSTSAPKGVSVDAAFKCAALVEESLSSYSTIKGSYDCFSKGLQKLLNNHGVTNDAGVAAFTQQFTEFQIAPCGNTYYKTNDGHYAFLFIETSVTDPAGDNIQGTYTNVVLVFVSTSTGKVDAWEVAGMNPNFEVPLSQNPTCTTKINWPKPQYID